MKPKSSSYRIYFYNRAYEALLSCGLFLQLSCLQVNAAQESPSIPVEMRGILTLPSESRFSLRKKDSGQVFWIEVGQERHGVKALLFDAAESILTVGFGGAEYNLSLVEAKDEYRWVVQSYTTDGMADEAPQEMRSPPRPARMQAIHSPQSLAERRERARQTREARGLRTDSSNAGVVAASPVGPEGAEGDSRITPPTAEPGTATDTLELQRGEDLTLITGRGRGNGAYRGTYVVRTPRTGIAGLGN